MRWHLRLCNTRFLLYSYHCIILLIIFYIFLNSTKSQKWCISKISTVQILSHFTKQCKASFFLKRLPIITKKRLKSWRVKSQKHKWQRGRKQNNLWKIHRGFEIITESQTWLGTGLLISCVAYFPWSNHGLILIKTISSMVIIKSFQSQHFYC